MPILKMGLFQKLAYFKNWPISKIGLFKKLAYLKNCISDWISIAWIAEENPGIRPMDACANFLSKVLFGHFCTSNFILFKLEFFLRNTFFRGSLFSETRYTENILWWLTSSKLEKYRNTCLSSNFYYFKLSLFQKKNAQVCS